MTAANDSDPSVRRQAIRQLGMRRVPEATHLLVSALKAADAAVQFQAAAALGRIGEPSAIPALLSVLGEQDFFLRYAVFTALNRIGRADSSSWPAIAKGLESDNARIREGTIFALRETCEPPLARALADVVRATAKPVEARVAAVELLANLHRKKPEWKGEWWAYHPVNSPPSAKTEKWEGTDIVQAVLHEGLDDRESRVRRAAVEGARETKLAGVAPKLRDMFRMETDLGLKRGILAALGALEDKASAELLAALFGSVKSDTALLPDAIANLIWLLIGQAALAAAMLILLRWLRPPAAAVTATVTAGSVETLAAGLAGAGTARGAQATVSTTPRQANALGRRTVCSRRLL